MSFLNLRKKKKEIPPSTKLGITKAAVASAPAKKITAREEKIAQIPVAPVGAGNVLLRPRVTEKATALSERGVYSFEVSRHATELEVKEAMRALYKVSPRKVAFIPLRRKVILVKGKKGRTKGGKKAYVFLKSGDKIELV